jgi:hypothetical protein
MIVCLSVPSAGCAPLAPYNPDRLPPAQMSRIGDVCHAVMGLPVGLDAHYLACEESLSRSLAARREASALLAARQTCEARGLQSEALAQCEQSPPQPAAAQTDQVFDAPLPASPVKSYFSASNVEINRREQEACIAIGEEPATWSLARCVADLTSTLWDADNPILIR